MNKKNVNYIIASLSALFVILIILLEVFDIKNIGQNNTFIGLSTLNKYVFETFGVNMFWYKLTEWLGVIAILYGFSFGVLGFCQLIKRKNFFKVDFDIMLLGFFYIVIIFIYIFFEKNIINYRPILLNGKIEASFPSSHVLLIVFVMNSSIIQFDKRVKNRYLRITLKLFSLIISILTILGRLISGVHWFTDIIGGLLLSVNLVLIYNSIVLHSKKK